MNPEKVNPRNFKVIDVLFNNKQFTIAYGESDNYNRLAMRWNGDGDDPGYPKLFNNPVWFFISDDLMIPILKSLINIENANNEQILKALGLEMTK